MTTLPASEIISRLYAPEVHLKNTYLSDFYKKNPLLSRCAMVPVGAAAGFSEVFLFPLISLVGAISFPILALNKLMKGDKKAALEYLKSFAFCLLGLGATIGFIAITGYCFNLTWCCATFITLLVASVTFHVYKMAKEPVLIES